MPIRNVKANVAADNMSSNGLTKDKRVNRLSSVDRLSLVSRTFPIGISLVAALISLLFNHVSRGEAF